MEKSFNKPRGQWMATDGRELYHNWVVDIINRRENNREDYDDIDLDYYGQGMESLAHNLHVFSRYYTKYMSAKDDNYRDEILSTIMAKSDELKHYASIDDFLGESSNWNRAIMLHSLDGLDFASRVSLGLALDAYESTHLDIQNNQLAYHDIANILHDESFQYALESVATTGFAVLQNRMKNVMFQPSTPLEVRSLIGVSSVDSGYHVIDGIRSENGQIKYKLNPYIVSRLHEAMRAQNVDKLTKGVGSFAVRQHIEGDHSSTTGCPVRRAPASENHDRRSPSAIALWADYMGSELERVVVPKFEP